MADTSAGIGAPGRAGNGLTATDWVRVARPRPAAAEDLLEALRRTGIAAFTDTPSGAGRVELWADATDLDDAATVLDAVVRHGPHDADAVGLVDEVETRIGDLDLQAPDLHDRGGDPDAPRGAAFSPTRNPTPSARPAPRPDRPSRPATPKPYIDRDRRLPETENDDLNDDNDDEFHFRPDEPPAVRGAFSRTTVWALVIFAVGVVALALSGLAPSLFFGYAPLTSLLGTAAVLVGVGMLVTRLRDGRRGGDDDHGGPNGDGAVI